MNTVIVTVKSANSSEVKDYEIPADMTARNIIKSMAEALKLPLNTAAVMYRIMAEPPGRYLGAEETLAQAGVWDGAILSIKK